MTTPQNPTPGPDLNSLRDRYGATPSGPIPRPQVPQVPQVPPTHRPPNAPQQVSPVPQPQGQHQAPPPAPHAPVVDQRHPALPHSDQEDPFGDLGDIHFHEVADNTPPEWRDKEDAPRDKGPLFDAHRPSEPAQRPSYEPSEDFFAGDDDFRRGVRKDTPKQGWRAFLANKLHIPIGKGKAELEYDSYISRINRSLLSPKVIGILGGKGGVGKTTTAMALASTLASIRSKPVVAITLDYNSTLALRTKEVAAPARGEVSLYDFATDGTIRTPNDIAGCMRSNKHRLSVLGAGLNPVSRESLTEGQFQYALDKLKSQYEVIVIDFGNTPNSDAYWAALKSLDLMVMVTSSENDAMQGARQIEKMAREVGLHDLLMHRTMEIISRRSPAEPKVDLAHFVSRLQSTEHREIIEIPWDEHFSESGPIDLDLLTKETRYQLILAAAIAVSNLPA